MELLPGYETNAAADADQKLTGPEWLLLVEFHGVVAEVEAGFLRVLQWINYLMVHSFSSFLVPSNFLADVVLDQVLVALLSEDGV